MDDPRRLVEALLKPDGEPLGELPRARSKVRRVQAGAREAQQLFQRLAQLGHDAPIPTYFGSRVHIPGVGIVGYRPVSKSGEPTVDVNVSIEGLENVKFKFMRP
jgi:hypothetical protein